MGFLIIASLLAGLALGFILLAEHLFFWPEQRKLSRPGAYAVGVGSGWLVFLPLTFILDIPQAAIAYLVMFAVGGSFTIGAWWIRDWSERERTAPRKRRLGQAEFISQDDIDRGRHGTSY